MSGEVYGDGNVIGDQSQSRVVKIDIKGDVNDGTVIAAGRGVIICEGIKPISAGDRLDPTNHR